MDIKAKSYDSVFLFCLIYILTIQPTFSLVKPPQPPQPPQCGQSPSSSDAPLIIGGHLSKKGAWPWIGQLGYGTPKDLHFACAGSLISPQTMITAGHCIFSFDLFMVRLGTNVLEESINPKDTPKPVDYSINNTIVHPGYNPKSSINDIGLVILDKPVQYTDLIKPICLPIAENLRKNTFDKTNAIAAGWGEQHEGGNMSTDLYEVTLPIVDIATCKRQFKNMSTVFVVDESVICAGYAEGGKDTCDGDSGGPLMLAVQNYYYLIGIVSRGYECARPNFSGIYTRTTFYLDFILKNLV